MTDPLTALLSDLESKAKAAKLPDSVQEFKLTIGVIPPDLDATDKLLKFFRAANPELVLRLVEVVRAAAEFERVAIASQAAASNVPTRVRHKPSCEVSVGFEQDPACTCGADEIARLTAQAERHAAELQAARAEAWEEGANEGWAIEDGMTVMHPNPYRTEKQGG